MSSDVDTDMAKRALAATDFADTPRSRRWMRAALDAALADKRARKRPPSSACTELLDELAYENPTPEEAWKLRDSWDPPFPLSVIDAAARRGFIETRGDRRSPYFAFRFTPAGRAALQSRKDMETP